MLMDMMRYKESRYILAGLSVYFLINVFNVSAKSLLKISVAVGVM